MSSHWLSCFCWEASRSVPKRPVLRATGLFVVHPLDKKVASRFEGSVSASCQSDLDEWDGGLPGRFCLTQHRLTPLIWSHFAWLHPHWLPVGVQPPSLREAQAGRRSLGLIGCWQRNAAGRILLTRALSSTVTPLAALLKPPPPPMKSVFLTFLRSQSH